MHKWNEACSQVNKDATSGIDGLQRLLRQFVDENRNQDGMMEKGRKEKCRKENNSHT